MNHFEDDNQKALFDWANHYPILNWMYANANGGKRNAREGRRLKAQGVKAGVWDIFLPLPMHDYHGLFIEMKHGKNKLTKKQSEFGQFVHEQGYLTATCYNWDEARRVITDYADLIKF